jgi:regulator of sirC expression with transglutaminase-like and TPR domain
MGPDVPGDDLDLERAAFDATRDGFDLLRAACLLARIEGRVPDVNAVVSAVDGWAAEVRDEVARRSTRQGPLHGLVTVLFARVRLRGDEEEYDAPRNSFLEDVVVRRRGLPISLCLLVVETARRAGLVACGLALPRHFMAGLVLRRTEGDHDGAPDGADLFFVDAFHGAVLSPEDVAARAGVPVEELAEHLAPAAPDVILARMLTNLRGSYLRRQDSAACARVLSRLLLLRPRDATLHLERAQLRRALGDDRGAVADAENAVMLARDPDEKDIAERVLEGLMRGAGWVH